MVSRSSNLQILQAEDVLAPGSLLQHGVCHLPVFCFFLRGVKEPCAASTKALSFTKLSAEKLGQKLLQWGADDWNQGPVTTKRVQRSKKNKGHKREWWINEVKAYHAGKGKNKGGGKSAEAEIPDAPLFPNAPWWNPSPTEEKEDKDEKPEGDCEVIEPLLKRSKKDGDDDDEDFGSSGFLPHQSMLKLFGP